MVDKKHRQETRCKYCEAISRSGPICSNCRKKLALIRQIRRMLLPTYHKKVLSQVSNKFQAVFAWVDSKSA